MVPGELGFLPIAYTGQATKPVTWTGPVTGALYRFVPGNGSLLVDKRDALEFLTRKRDEWKVFQLSREEIT